jgi:hypothetical protein
MSLFCQLPMDVVKYILQFDERYIIRKGEIVSVIPKSDHRYNLLKFVTLQNCVIECFHDMTRYNYELDNLHDYRKRDCNNSDLLQVSIFEKNDIVEYVVWIGRLVPKRVTTNKRQIYHIENPKKYHWKYIEYEYSRK